MKNLSSMATALAGLLAVQFCGGSAYSQIVTSGELVLGDFGGDPSVPDVTIDRITFDVSDGTSVNFDALVWETPFDPEDDLNGDGEVTWTDFQMTLLDSEGNILVRHDDGPRGPDGSISGFDGNFTHTFDNGGTYVLGVGSTLPTWSLFTSAEVQAGFRLDFGSHFGGLLDHCDWQVTLTATGGTVSNVVVDTLGIPATPNPNAAPEVVCSVDTETLSTPNHKLVDVGLSFLAADDLDPDPIVEVLVFCNEFDDDSTGDGNHEPDAVIDDTDRLWLRAEREGDTDGRVYLIVVQATDTAGDTGFDCSTVVTPHDGSEASIAATNAEAELAEAACLATGDAPDGYQLLGSVVLP